MFELTVGVADVDEVLASASTDVQRCQAAFYAAERELIICLAAMPATYSEAEAVRTFFAAGQAEALVPLMLLGDILLEPDEQVLLTLLDPAPGAGILVGGESVTSDGAPSTTSCSSWVRRSDFAT